MKLLLIYVTLLFLFLLAGTGNAEASSDGEVTTEVVLSPTQISAEHPAIIAETNWLQTYFFMLKVLNPVKQLDLPGDYKSYNGVPCKSLNSGQKTAFIERQEESYVSKYMRLLSVRYSDGFYTYSQGKLII